jgi:hypothetical protein
MAHRGARGGKRYASIGDEYGRDETAHEEQLTTLFAMIGGAG